MSPAATPTRPRILGVGIACLDYLFVSPRFEHGGQARLHDHLIQGGGLVGTALVAAARLGASTEIWTWVGEDDEGRQVIDGLGNENVDASLVEVIPGARTPVSFVHVEAGSGERTIIHGPRLDLPEPSLARLEGRAIAADALLVDAVWPQASRIAAGRARQAGIPVVGDFYPDEHLAGLARAVSALIVPAGPADRQMPNATRDEQLQSLARFGPEFVAITSGSDGCYYLDRGSTRHQPSFPVDVVDTTGAGDVFHGAFAYALARRWPIDRVVDFASAVAALSCRALGGRTAAPTLPEALALLRSRSPFWSQVTG